MQHFDRQTAEKSSKVYDVRDYCRLNDISETESEKLLRVLGRFASRLEIQINLTNRPSRYR